MSEQILVEGLLRRQELVDKSIGLLSKSLELLNMTIKLYADRLAKLETEQAELKDKTKQILQRLIALEGR